MKTCNPLDLAQRHTLIVLALFPTLWGLFSLLNNISGFTGTAENAIYPLLTMSNTYGNPAQIWRAIDSPLFAQITLLLITGTEAMAGILGLLAIICMIRKHNSPYEAFVKGKVLLIYACLAAVMVWGVGFMVIAGDWFLAWQAAENALETQLGGMIYAIPCLLTIIVCISHREISHST